MIDVLPFADPVTVTVTKPSAPSVQASGRAAARSRFSAAPAAGHAGSVTVTAPGALSVLSNAGTVSPAALTVMSVPAAQSSGIPEDRLATIFDLFVTHTDDGTGLGLGLARQIVSEHMGTIDVESSVGVGTTFRARFPGFPEDTPRSVGHRGRALPPGFRVLFVDDDARLRRLYARLFPEQATVVVATVDEAMRVIAEQKIECIVCDVHMPEEDGLRLYGRIRAEHPELSSRFVFVSGTDAMLARVRDEAPNVQLVRKPFVSATRGAR